ncbi:hypothetical protein C1H46_026402 [Malus baccata]|uniref:Uncharacterized protein n=1 Tax=Malus baccata TaxID=106549 RepID=A0A540LNZ4_MALBA|nr:hypothetical protein C1H46_026402 [Malus baccata]
MATTTPGEDDMELERQLQSLNKPIVKTFQVSQPINSDDIPRLFVYWAVKIM